MGEGKKTEPDVLRDAPFDMARCNVDPINGVDLAGMRAALRKTPAERLYYNTIAARNVARMVRAARAARRQ
jgi:hypothetical protein